jgi:hypothetical protein
MSLKIKLKETTWVLSDKKPLKTLTKQLIWADITKK